MPSFYAWFNTAASWDPYGNTGNLKVALVSADEGYSSDLLPVTINFGDRVVADLSKSDAIGYVITDEDDAIEGVRSGEYYAAIVLPEDFSDSMMSVLSGTATNAHITYYSNEKRNAIASIVTSKASTAVKETIDETFKESLVAVGAGVMDDLTDYLDDDQLLELAATLDSTLDGTADLLYQTADTTDTYASLVGSVYALMTSADTTLGTSTADLTSATDALTQTADAVRQADDALSGASTSVNSAISTSVASFDDVSSAIDSAYSEAGGQAQKIASALASVQTTVQEKRSGLQSLRDALASLNGQVHDFEAGIDLGGDTAELDLEYVHTVEVDIQSLLDEIDAALTELDLLDEGISSTIQTISTAGTDAEATRQSLLALVDSAAASTQQVKSDYEGTLSGSLASLADAIDDASASATSIASSVGTTMASLESTTDGVTSDLSDLQSDLEGLASDLRDAAAHLQDLEGTLSAAIASDNVDLIRTIIGSDPSALAAFISTPVDLTRHAVYPVENNGSAMAPYYTTMSLWVGGTLLGCVVSTRLSKRGMKETGAKPHHAYLGRLVYFLIIGFFQSTIVCLGDLYFLGIQCVHPLLFMIAGWATSFVFINIIYSLSASFGDVGKAIAVLLMVIQVAGSGGSFPAEMLPKAFQALYPYLPYVHAETAMRAAIAGIYGNEFWVSIGKLLAFVIPALTLGLALRVPFQRLSEWFEGKLESTHVM